MLMSHCMLMTSPHADDVTACCCRYWVETILSTILFREIYNNRLARSFLFKFLAYVLPVMFMFQVCWGLSASVRLCPPLPASARLCPPLHPVRVLRCTLYGT